jgi:DNA-binding SARP family transcriptional activator
MMGTPKGGRWVASEDSFVEDNQAFEDRSLAVDIVDRHPYALLLEDADGHLLGHNRAARRILGPAVDLDDASPHAACAIVGCRRPGGPLADLCLHERALDHDGPLPEVRVDLAHGGEAEAAWVTVAALGRERQLVLTELRPGQREDRRRRTEPHWTTGPRLRIHALGRTRVTSAEAGLDGRWLDNRAGQILKYLVCERHRSVYSDEIVERLWPNAGRPGTRGLRYFIHVLREQLEPHGAPIPPSSFVLATRGGYVFDRSKVWVDANEFEDLVETGLAAHERGDEERAADHLRRGLALYGGDFLEDEPYAEWAFHERDRLRQIASNGLRALAELDDRHGDLEAATTSLVRLTDLEPYDVDVHRDLLAMLLRRGRRSEALRRFEALRRRMLTTFGEELGFSLADLGPASPESSGYELY